MAEPSIADRAITRRLCDALALIDVRVLDHLVIGDGEMDWDAVAIVEYPSIDAFRQMTASPEYDAVHVHREAGLAHQLLINCLSTEQLMAGLGGQ